MPGFTNNSKTIISLDFSRQDTCSQICGYCYVNNTERMYKAYSKKIEENSKLVNEDSLKFSELLNNQYAKAIRSKSKTYERLDKMPARIYGSGDYMPVHYKMLENLNFKFYIISKNLTRKAFKSELDRLKKLNNLATIVLSFDKDNIDNYKDVQHLFKTNGYKFAYTGMADEFNKLTQKFDIFFNISDKKSEKLKSRSIKEQCPCDSGVMAHNKSCSICNKCWRSK